MTSPVVRHHSARISGATWLEVSSYSTKLVRSGSRAKWDQSLMQPRRRGVHGISSLEARSRNNHA